MTLLRISDLSVSLGGRRVIDGVDLSIERGEIVGLIGPNGAGKTTLMRAALGLLPASGDSDLTLLSPRERARRVAWLPQEREIAWPVTVETLVAFGRLAEGAVEARAEVVEAALARMELQDLRRRPATDLSGGERARVLIARALAQDTPLLLADESTAGLDPAHQIATMRVFEDLAREGRAILVSLHDLGLALRHCSRLVMLETGRIVADGAPREVLAPARLAETFGIDAEIVETPRGPVLQVLGALA